MLQHDLAPAVAQARAGDAVHRADRRGRGARCCRAVVDRVVPARRAALADRSGADLEHRHERARAAAHPPLAEPRVRAQRRARAAGGAGVHGSALHRFGGASSGGASCSRTSASASLSGSPCGWLASLLMPRDERTRPLGASAIPRPPASRSSRSASRSPTYGLAVLSPDGNGFIAVFVAGDRARHPPPGPARRTSSARPPISSRSSSSASSSSSARCSRCTLFTREGWAALALAAVVFAARPPAGSLAGADGDAAPTRRRALFMGWFGPRASRSMTFALLVLDRTIASGTADLQPDGAHRVLLDPRPRRD